MKKIFKTRKAIAITLSLILLIQTLLVATVIVPASANTTANIPAAAEGEKVVANIAGGLAEMANDGWFHYYHENYYYHYQSPMTKQVSDSSMWYVTTRAGESVLSRNDSYKTHNYRKPWSNISQIVYEGKTFENFEVKARIYFSQHTLGNDTPLYIGFGQSDSERSLLNQYSNYSGGKGIAIGEGGNVALINPYGGTHGETDNDLVFTTSQSIADDVFYDFRMLVLDGKATIYVNDNYVTTYNISGTTKGFVSFGGARANASGFSKFEVTEYKRPDVSANIAGGLSGMAADGWTHYYHESYYYNTTSAMTAMSADDALWYIRDISGQKVLARKMDAKVNYATKYPWGNISQIVYTGKTFKNFEINATVLYSQHSAGNKTPLYIGFGKKNTAYSLLSKSDNHSGGMGIAIGDGGNVALVSGATYPLSNGNNNEIGLTYTTSQTIADDIFYDVNVKVANGVATVKVNNVQVAQYTLPGDSEGYVSFGGSLANASGFSKFEVSEIEVPDVEANIAGGLAGMSTDGWTHYYHESYYYHYISTMTAKPADNTFWYVGDIGGTKLLRRAMDVADTHKTYKPWGNVSQIVFTGKTFKNFEINATAYYSQHSRGNDTPLYIGFGKTNLGVSMFNIQGGYTGGMGIAIGDGGNVALVARYNGTHGDTSGNNLTYTTSQSIPDDTFFDITVRVLDGVATVLINGAQVTQYTLPNNTEGYVSFGSALANASGFSKFEITEYKKPDFSADFSNQANFVAQNWKHYYTTETSQSAVAATSMGKNTGLTAIWNFSTSDRISVSNYSVPNSTWMEKWYSLSHVVYETNTFKDFDLDVSYSYSVNSGNNEKRTLYIGFGKTKLAKSIFDTTGAGGLALALRYDGNVALVNNGIVGEYTSNPAISVGENINLRLSVSDTTAKVYRNDSLIATYMLPSSYDGGYLFFGATRATSAGFTKFDVYGEPLAPLTPLNPNLYEADIIGDIQDAALWKSYWAKDVIADSTLNSISLTRSFLAATDDDGAPRIARTKQNADHTGTMLSETEFETYSATFNVAQITYIAKKYKNFELNATYAFSTHSHNNSRVLIGFGRKDATKYATHADGGAVLEFDSNANVVYRDANGSIKAEVSAPESAAKTTKVSVKVVVDAWIAKVYVNNTELGSFIVPEDYEGYISIGATQANSTKFYAVSILATEDNEAGETRPTPVDPNTLPYETRFNSGLPEGWKSYWMKDMLIGSELAEKSFGISWYPRTGDDGYISRTDSGSFFENSSDSAIVSSTFNVAQLAFANRKFKNFEMEFDYKYVGAVGARILLGFGRRDLTKFANHEDGGAVISLASDGNFTVTVAGGTPYSMTNTAPESAAKENMVKVKVKVDAWLCTVWVNDVEMGTYLLPEDYEGYISIGATKALPSQIHAIKVTPLDDNTQEDVRPDENLYSPDMQQYSIDFTTATPNGWSSYWIEDITAEEDAGSLLMGPTPFGYHWVLGSSGYISRTDSGYMSNLGVSVNGNIENDTYNIVQLTNTERKFNNFIMNFTYVYNSDGDGRIMLGFGRKDITRFATHQNGGIVLSFNSSANVSAYIAGQPETELSNMAPGSAARYNEVNVKLTVDNWIATVNINGVDVAAYLLPEDYKGYISVGATRAKSSQFKSVTVLPLEDNTATDVRPTEAPSFDTDWSEIIGKEPDNGIPPTVSGLPFFDVSLDGDGENYIIRAYDYGMPIKFYNDIKVILLPWENITIGELIESVWISKNVKVEFTLPDGTLLEEQNTILINGLLMNVYEGDNLSLTYKILVGELLSGNEQEADKDVVDSANKSDDEDDSDTDNKQDNNKDDTTPDDGKDTEKPSKTDDKNVLAWVIAIIGSLLVAVLVIFIIKKVLTRRKKK